ncbi:MAG: hypothetical protein IPL92_18450 [Saprospiraceae bacterium]|nr:hypothetical protein [Candidatus Opimibacter iunctus]
MEQGNQGDTPTDLIKLTQRQVIDKEGTGLVASTYLIPPDWSVQDRLYWEYGDATLPIRFKATMQNSDATMGIQIFPDVRAVWSRGPSGVTGYRPPVDILSGMKDLIMAERKGKNITYVNQKVLFNESQNSNQARQNTQGGVINVQYEENGQTIDEEFYAKLDIVEMSTPSMMGNMTSVIWAASGMYACKAVTGKLDECRKIAQTVASSGRITKPFYNRLAQVIQLLSDQVYAQIYQAGQLSKIISQTNDQMIANIDASYSQSQATADRSNNQFSDYIRGVDRYSDGGSEIQLPSGYANAWINDKGEYILTNTMGWNPGTDFNGNWKQLERN